MAGEERGLAELPKGVLLPWSFRCLKRVACLMSRGRAIHRGGRRIDLEGKGG